MTRFVFCVVASLLFGILFEHGTAAAWCQLTTSHADPEGRACVEGGRPLSWMRPCISYSVDMRGSNYQEIDDVRRIVQTSFDSWTETLCDGVTIDIRVEETAETSTCQKAKYRTSGANVNTVAFLSDWPNRYGDDAYAITTVWHRRSTGEIFDADILVNEERFPWTECEPRSCPDAPDGEPFVDLQNVMTHEAGHFFGLAHSQLLAATMDPQSARGDLFKRILRTDDAIGICTIYPPGAMTGECDFTPRGGLDLNCEDDGGGCSAGGTGGRMSLLVVLLFVRRR